MALPGDSISLIGCEITAAEVEEKILNFLRARLGQPIRQWDVLNAVATHWHWKERRTERTFCLRQLNRLIREKKVIRYRREMLRGKIRISEIYAYGDTQR